MPRISSYSLMLLLAVLLGAVGCGGGNDSSDGGAETGGAKIVVGPSVSVSNTEIPTAGGAITVPPGSPIAGFEIEIPDGAYDETKSVAISYAPIESHAFGSLIVPVLPLIRIDDGGGTASQPILITIPLSIHDDEFAMAFAYNESTGELEGLPLVTMTSQSLSVLSLHLSGTSSGLPPSFTKQDDPLETRSLYILVSKIFRNELEKDADSGFRPGQDDWQFRNLGSHIAPRGHCSGQSVAAMWYYAEKPRSGAPHLYGLYDNNGNEPRPAGFWQDDSNAYRLCSVLQKESSYGSLSGRLIDRFQNLSYAGDQETMAAFSYALRVTGNPQLVFMWGEKNGEQQGHAMIVYRKEGKKLYVADPNYSGAADREISLIFTEFYPYASGSSASDLGTLFSKIRYMAVGAFLDWSSIAGYWSQMENGTIGDEQFPSYTLKALNDDDEYVELEDGFTRTSDYLTVLIQANSFDAHFMVYDAKGFEIAVSESGIIRGLDKGKQRIGFHITDEAGKYVDFRWFEVEIKGLGVEMKCTAFVNVAVEGYDPVPFDVSSATSSFDDLGGWTFRAESGAGEYVYLTISDLRGSGAYSCDGSQGAPNSAVWILMRDGEWLDFTPNLYYDYYLTIDIASSTSDSVSGSFSGKGVELLTDTYVHIVSEVSGSFSCSY